MAAGKSYRAGVALAVLLGLGACAACCLPLLLPVAAGLGLYTLHGAEPIWWMVAGVLVSGGIVFRAWRRRRARCLCAARECAAHCKA